MNILEQIQNFGAIDAENDDKLLEYFYRSNIIDNLFEYNKSIVIGRKGSGKTAIYKYIQDQKKEESISLLFRDYPWKLHDNFKNNNVSERESYVNSWTFLFYIEIFKSISKSVKAIKDKNIQKQIKKLKRWIEKNWGSITFDHKETLFPTKKRNHFIFSPSVLGNSLGSFAREIENTQN